MEHDKIWETAGNPHAVFNTTLADLAMMAEGPIMAVK